MQFLAGAGVAHGRDTIWEGHGRNTVETQLEGDTIARKGISQLDRLTQPMSWNHMPVTILLLTVNMLLVQQNVQILHC